MSCLSIPTVKHLIECGRNSRYCDVKQFLRALLQPAGRDAQQFEGVQPVLSVPEHSLALNNLGGMLRQALAICEDCLGARHPYTLIVYENLARLEQEIFSSYG